MATTTRVLDANVNGTAYTANANGALEAIDTCHSGTTAPTDEVANGKFWLDTTTSPGILKMYNNAAWEVVHSGTVDINDGAIDGTTIGATTPAAITGTALTATGAFTSRGIYDNATSTAMTLDSSGNVGIGAASAGFKLDVSGSIISRVSTTGDSNFTATTTGGGALRISPDDATIGNPTWTYKTNSSEPHAWQIGGVERLRLDASGNLLSGKTSPLITSVGVEMRGSQGVLTVTSQDAPASYFTRMGTAGGPILAFYRDSTHAGVIGASSDADLYIGEDAVGLQFQNSGTDRIDPYDVDGQTVRDNAIDLGGSSSRFDDVYATNGTIQTSDRNEKEDIASLTPTEMLVAARLSAGFKNFRWKDSVAEKGAAARVHSGVIAQDVQDAFTAEGLEAGDYSMFISATWWTHDVDVPAVEAVVEVVDEEGVVVTEAVEAVAAYTRTDTYDTEAEAPVGAVSKTRLGVRYPELLSFVAAYNEQRFASIEARLTALEAA
jgi:hypothetical protein